MQTHYGGFSSIYGISIQNKTKKSNYYCRLQKGLYSSSAEAKGNSLSMQLLKDGQNIKEIIYKSPK